MSNRKAVPTAQQAQSKPEKSAKVTALRHAIMTGLKDLEHGRFTEVQDANLERYISDLGMQITET